MIQKGEQMCEELKELLAPEIVVFKIRLAEQDAYCYTKRQFFTSVFYVSFFDA